MPYSYVQRPLGGTAPQTVPFPYLARDHVKLLRNYNLTTGEFEQLLIQGVHFTWINDFSISVDTALAGVLTILRQTPTDSRLVDWANGSNLTAEPMDTADLQVFYAFQELYDRGVISGIAAANALATTTFALMVDSVDDIPTTPETGLRLEIRDSTGIESLGVSGAPPGFVGGAGLRVRIRRTAIEWEWEDYRPADPDGRYVERADVASSLQEDRPGLVLSIAGARQLIYTPVASKASLPEEPLPGARFIILDSTGIESPTPPVGMPTGFTGNPGLRVQLFRAASAWLWDGYQAADPDARYRLRRGSASVTITAGAGETVTGAISLPRACHILSILSSRPAWVRIYNSNAAAAADAARPRGTPPGLGAGVIADPVLPAEQSVNLEPVLCAVNRETTPTNSYPVRATNDGVSGDIVLAMSYLLLES